MHVRHFTWHGGVPTLLEAFFDYLIPRRGVPSLILQSVAWPRCLCNAHKYYYDCVFQGMYAM